MLNKALGVGLFFLCYSVLATPLSWSNIQNDPFDHSLPSASLKISQVAIHFLDPKVIIEQLSNPKLGLLSSDGVMIYDQMSHSIWMREAPERIKLLKQWIARLDHPQRQILLQSRVVSVDSSYVRDLGIGFQTEKGDSSHTASMGTGDHIGHINIPIVKLANNTYLDAKLNVLERQGHANVIASPEVVAVDRTNAVIESGEEVPYQQETVGGATNVAFKKAVLRLQVTPTLLGHHRVLLQLIVNQDKVSALTVQGVPAIHTQQLSTRVMLFNRQTFVLGGIYEQTRSNQMTGVPILSRIPLLGVLFRNHRRVREHRELLIFITPKIL